MIQPEEDENLDSFLEAQSFVKERLLQIHSGIYPDGAVSRPPRMNEWGEYDDPPIREDMVESVAQIAALGPFRESEESIAHRLFSSGELARFDEDLGWHVGLYTGYVNDEVQRLRSSSGGIATALLVEMLEQDAIDGVIHMKPASDGTLFRYEISRCKAEIIAGAKTRYYPGSLYDCLAEVRRSPGRYAVVGIPSFISEMRRLETIDPTIRERVLFHIGLICGHQKTANYVKNLAWQVQVRPESLVTVDFRVKNPATRANDYSTKFVYRLDDGETREKTVPQRELYGSNWGWGMFKSYFSDLSEDPFNATADIVLGDAWLPSFVEDYRGTNIVIVRSERVQEVLRSMCATGVISLAQSSTVEVVSSQSGLLRHMCHEVGFRRKWLGKHGLPVSKADSDDDSRSERLSITRQTIQRFRLRIALSSHRAYVNAVEENSYSAFLSLMKWHVLGYRITDRVQRFQRKAGRLTSLIRQLAPTP